LKNITKASKILLLDRKWFRCQWKQQRYFFFVLIPHIEKALHEAHEIWKKGGEKFIWKDNAALSDLALQIDEKKKQMNCKDIFVSLSSRSPKDAPLSMPQFLQTLTEEKRKVEQIEKEVGENTSAINQRLHALYRCATYSMKASDSSFAILLLIHSKRIQDDLVQYFTGSVQDFHIVLREFRTFDPDLEFRGFVMQKKLTALTQVLLPTLEALTLNYSTMNIATFQLL
jgi:hypothetical protein